MKKTTRLKELLYAKEIVAAPGAHDVMTAKIIEKVGFDMAYMTGYGTAASTLGKPDIGLLCMSEMLDRARKLATATNIPIVADGDTGFGNAVTLMRTIEDFEDAGVAGIQLEDQIAPKRCGHMAGRKVVSMEEMIGKIEAAITARRDPDFVIIARTDARTSLGIDEAIKRALAYEKAGADAIFVESIETIEEMKWINQVIKAPTIVNIVEGGRTPQLTDKELEELGFNLVIHPVASTYVIAKAVFDLMHALKRDGSTKAFADKMITFNEFNELIGLGEYSKYEDLFVRD